MALYFITEKYLIDSTPLTKNVEATEIMPFTKTAADLRIQPILGTLFYKELLQKYNDQTLNNNERELHLLIRPAVAWRACALSVIPGVYQFKNKGLQKQSGEFSESVALNEANRVVSYYEQMAEHYENLISAYLNPCTIDPTKFPTFSSKENLETSLIKPKQTNSSETYIMVI